MSYDHGLIKNSLIPKSDINGDAQYMLLIMMIVILRHNINFDIIKK